MDLPVELRDMVYEELVVVGKIFYTPDEYAVMTEKRFKDWKSYRVPCLAILRVSKQVHDEAEKVYLGKNLFVLPDQATSRQPFIQSVHCNNGGREPGTKIHIPFPDRWLFSASAPGRIKNISVGFSWRTNEGLSAIDYPDWRLSVILGKMTLRNRMQRAHIHTLFSLQGDIDGYISDLYSFFHYGGGPYPKRFKYLEFDLTNAYCSTGCCRTLDQEWFQLMVLGPEKTAFLGTRNAKEEGIIMKHVHKHFYGEESLMHKDFRGKLEVDRNGMRKVFGITFNPEKTHWEQRKVDDEQEEE
jgi:hypothetical protein